jgi:hypothetical protein
VSTARATAAAIVKNRFRVSENMVDLLSSLRCSRPS